MNDVRKIVKPKRFSKKELLIFLCLTVMVAVGVGGYAYYKSTPTVTYPTLEFELTSLAQGKLTTINGFADLPSSYGYACNGSEISLERNVNHLFSTKVVTMKQVADSLKFTGNSGQYLVAFFSPGNETAVNNSKNEEGWYIYPTTRSPFNSPFNSQAISEGAYKINSITDDGFEIPAYRGFQIIVNNSETKMCGVDFKLSSDSTNVWKTMTNDELTAKIKGLPDGWVMIPMLYENDKQTLESILRVIDDGVDAKFFQTEKNAFVFHEEYNESKYPGYSMAWLYIKDGAISEPVDEEPVDEEPVDEEPVDEEPVDEEPVDDVDVLPPEADVIKQVLVIPEFHTEELKNATLRLLPTIDFELKFTEQVKIIPSGRAEESAMTFDEVPVQNVVLGEDNQAVTFRASFVSATRQRSLSDDDLIGDHILIIDGFTDLDGNILEPIEKIITITQEDVHAAKLKNNTSKETEDVSKFIEEPDPLMVIDELDPIDPTLRDSADPTLRDLFRK